MSRLEDLLSSPSHESWRDIVELGKQARKIPGPPDPVHLDELLAGSSVWSLFCRALVKELRAWPPEIERLCPPSWPEEFRRAVEHRVIETDTYEHYVAKICGDPRLLLSDGKMQAVWLERRFTGGVVPVSVAQVALRGIGSALESIGAFARAPSISAATRCIEAAKRSVENARNVLANGVRRVGKVGCADLTGGLVVERQRVKGFDGDSFAIYETTRHEYRLEIEIKVGDEPQSDAQKIRMQSVRARGGCYVLARSVEEAVQAIIAFRDGR